MKLIGSTERKTTKDKNGENEPHVEIVELVLVHCNLVNNDYQQNSRILFTFALNKPFCSLLEISPTNHIFLKIFNSEFPEIKAWFTDQTSKPLEVEDKINLTLIINGMDIIKIRYLIEPRDRRYTKGYGFLSFAKNIGKSISNKYIQRLVGIAKQSATDAIKTASKRAIQKTALAPGDLFGNKIADKIKNVSTELESKKSPKELLSNEANNEIPKERYISLQERQQIVDELRLL